MVTFSSMGGRGNLTCLDCGYKQQITSFLHGVNRWYRAGYQCQTCGEITAIESNDRWKTICRCGGKLSRKKELFCPQCKGTNLDYFMTLIT